MRYLKKEYRDVVLNVIFVGYKHGVKNFCVCFADGREEEMTEEEAEKFFK